jgi:hypothetical protein
MKRKEIIELAKKNGMTEFVPVGKNDLWAQIEVWVTMAVEEEREACAKVCDVAATYQKKYLNTHAQGVAIGCAIAIRARGQT